MERKNELLEALKQDEAARRFLKHAIETKGGEEVEPLKDIKPDAVTKLESFGLFELIDHKHVLKDEVELEELQQILVEAVESKEVPKQVKLSGSPFLKREWLEKWETMLSNGGALDYFAALVNPKIAKLEYAKKIVFLSLVSASDKFGDRGRIHTLLYGREGTAKSTIGMWLVHRLGIEGASHRSSDVGLTGDARGSEIVPGALPAADGSAIYIDELDKFDKKDLNGLLENLMS